MSDTPKKGYTHIIISILRVEKSQTVRINLFPTRRPYGFPKKYFEELIEVSFEGENFNGSKFYESYLKIKYNNYMELPLVDKRKTHPVERIKF